MTGTLLPPAGPGAEERGADPSPARRPTLSRRPDPHMDPRLAARRQQIRQKRYRRRVWRAIWFLLPLVVGCLLFALSRSSLFDVDNVEVRGIEFTARQSVIEAAGVEPGEPMTSVNLDAAVLQVAELPWVDQVNVARQWPGTVRIDVVERVPVVSLESDDGWWYLADDRGVVLAQVSGPAAGVLQIEDYPARPVVGERLDPDGRSLVEVASRLPRSIERNLVALEVSEAVGVEIVVNSQPSTIRVWFGSSEDVDAKFGSLIAVLDQVDLTGVCTVDVRVPEFPAVQRRTCA